MYLFNFFTLLVILLMGSNAAQTGDYKAPQKRKLDNDSFENEELAKVRKLRNINEIDEAIIDGLKRDLEQADPHDDDVDAVNDKVQNPRAKLIHLAARRGMTELVLKLLDEDDFHEQYLQPSSTGFTILHAAAYKGHKELAEKLLQYYSNHPESALVKPTTEWRVTALHVAAEQKHTEIAEVFLNSGFSELLQSDNSGRTALHIAVKNNCVSLVKILLAAPDLTVLYFLRNQKNEGFPFHVACRYSQNLEIFRAFIGDVHQALKDFHLNSADDELGYPHHMFALNRNWVVGLGLYARQKKLRTLLYTKKNKLGFFAYDMTKYFRDYEVATSILTMKAVDAKFEQINVSEDIQDYLGLKIFVRVASCIYHASCNSSNFVVESRRFEMFKEIIANDIKEFGVFSAADIDSLIETIIMCSKIVTADICNNNIAAKVLNKNENGFYTLLTRDNKQVLLHPDKCEGIKVEVGGIVYFKRILNNKFASKIVHFHYL